MKVFILVVLSFICSLFLAYKSFLSPSVNTGAPPYDGSGRDFVPESKEQALLRDWKRPEGPATVALQVGHWKSSEAPDELHKLRNNTGASGGGYSEWEVNYKIAQETAKLLREKGIDVTIHPTTMQPHFFADVFISIHADGSEEAKKSGFKIAASRRDYTGKANTLVAFLEESYQKATELTSDPNITRNMTGYYAFSWWRYDHAVHPMTISAIVETGFLTNSSDRTLITENPEKSAAGIANGVIAFLQEEKLLGS